MTKRRGSILVRRTNDGLARYQGIIQRNHNIYKLTFDTYEEAERWLNKKHEECSEKKIFDKMQGKIAENVKNEPFLSQNDGNFDKIFKKVNEIEDLIWDLNFQIVNVLKILENFHEKYINLAKKE